MADSKASIRQRLAAATLLFLIGLAGPTAASTEAAARDNGIKQLLAGLPILQPFTQVGIEADDRPLVVVTLSSVCPCSGSHLAHLAELAIEFEAFRFVGLMTDFPVAAHHQAETLESLATAGRGLDVLNDVQLEVSRYLAAETTPHVFVRTAAGETLYQGAVTSASTYHADNAPWLREALVAISQGHAPPQSSTTPLGCSISY